MRELNFGFKVFVSEGADKDPSWQVEKSKGGVHGEIPPMSASNHYFSVSQVCEESLVVFAAKVVGWLWSQEGVAGDSSLSSVYGHRYIHVTEKSIRHMTQQTFCNTTNLSRDGLTLLAT